MAALCLIAFLVFAVLDWVAVAQARKHLEYLAKPAALAFLILFAALGEDVTWVLVAALVLSLLGDVYLMLPDALFPAGLVAFLLGHFGYIAAFDATRGSRFVWFLIVAGASLPLALRILRAVREPPLRLGVGIYMATISLMVASAIASGSLVAALGALLFFASDAMIALRRFVTPFSGDRLGVIVTYHLGQLLLVLALR